MDRRGQLTGEEEIDVIANDLTIEERGRMERGGALGIVGGGWKRISELGNLSVEPWSEVIEISRGTVREDTVRAERVNGFVFLKNMALFVGPAILAE